MRIGLEVPGHDGIVGSRLADGSLLPESDVSHPPVGYRAMCSCGWIGDADYPPAEHGQLSATSDWAQHMKPLWAAAPPQWLLGRSDSLREDLADLTGRWPLQALTVLADVERWQRPLVSQAVAAARENGISWAEIGAALGITKQSAHERFNAAKPPKPPKPKT